jgi:pyruvate formate lyase activating enzyme
MVRGIIFDIQSYAIYDGPGIRTTIFFKGCPLSCQWCQNPESQKMLPQLSYNQSKCKFCGNCAKICPTHIIQIIPGIRQFDESKCDLCQKCVQVCPNGALEIIGRFWESQELVDYVSGDKPFFTTSGGGITISGGEPTNQPEFLFEILHKLKKNGIHTAIETCGYFSPPLIPRLLECVDLFLFDLKHPHSEMHKQYTGVENSRILNNFTQIVAASRSKSVSIIPRLPLIPGVNTEISLIQEICNFLHNCGYNGEVHLMPYNRLAKTKYGKIGKQDNYQDYGDLSPNILDSIRNTLIESGFSVVINH